MDGSAIFFLERTFFFFQRRVIGREGEEGYCEYNVSNEPGDCANGAVQQAGLEQGGSSRIDRNDRK